MTGSGLTASSGGHLGREVAFLLLDALAQRIAHEALERHRGAGGLGGLGDDLRDGLGGIVDEGLVDQADFLEVGLHAGLDDLVEDIGGLARVLVAQHILLALDNRRIDARRIQPSLFER